VRKLELNCFRHLIRLPSRTLVCSLGFKQYLRRGQCPTMQGPCRFFFQMRQPRLLPRGVAWGCSNRRWGPRHSRNGTPSEAHTDLEGWQWRWVFKRGLECNLPSPTALETRQVASVSPFQLKYGEKQSSWPKSDPSRRN
jgi:hypothetical protein